MSLRSTNPYVNVSIQGLGGRTNTPLAESRGIWKKRGGLFDLAVSIGSSNGKGRRSGKCIQYKARVRLKAENPKLNLNLPYPTPVLVLGT
jgi:hypothetical protein